MNKTIFFSVGSDCTVYGEANVVVFSLFFNTLVRSHPDISCQNRFIVSCWKASIKRVQLKVWQQFSFLKSYDVLCAEV